MEDDMSYLELFASNPGLQHLAHDIFSRLDPMDLAKCQRISKPIKNFVDTLVLEQIKKCIATRNSNMLYANQVESRIRERQNEMFYKLIFEKVKSCDLPDILKFMKRHWTHPKSIISSNNYNKLDLNLLQNAVIRNQDIVVKALLDCQTSLPIDYRSVIFEFDGISLLFYAFQLECDKTIKVILTHPKTKIWCIKDVWDRNRNRNILHFACTFEKSEMIRTVLDFSLEHNINWHTADIGGYFPFHRLVLNGSVEDIKLLLSHPTSKHASQMVDSQVINGSPLHFACQRRSPEIVKLILDFAFENGHLIKMDIIDFSGLTALQYACRYGINDIVQLILQYHVKTNTQSLEYSCGKTPLDIVREYEVHKKYNDTIVKELSNLKVDNCR